MLRKGSTTEPGLGRRLGKPRWWRPPPLAAGTVGPSLSCLDAVLPGDHWPANSLIRESLCGPHPGLVPSATISSAALAAKALSRGGLSSQGFWCGGVSNSKLAAIHNVWMGWRSSRIDRLALGV